MKKKNCSVLDFLKVKSYSKRKRKKKDKLLHRPQSKY